MLPAGRLSVSALAAPRTERLWPDLAAEIDESLREGGATVRSFTGEWGRELHARTGDASSLFVGVDGPRWMLYGVATGPTSAAAELDAALRTMLRGTVVVRGRSPYPVRTVLPLTVPDQLPQAGVPDRVPVPRMPAERTRAAPRPPGSDGRRPDHHHAVAATVADGVDTVPHGIPRSVPGALGHEVAGRTSTAPSRPPTPGTTLQASRAPTRNRLGTRRGEHGDRRRDRGLADRLAGPVPPPAGAARRPRAAAAARRGPDRPGGARPLDARAGPRPRPGPGGPPPTRTSAARRPEARRRPLRHPPDRRRYRYRHRCRHRYRHRHRSANGHGIDGTRTNGFVPRELTHDHPTTNGTGPYDRSEANGTGYAAPTGSTGHDAFAEGAYLNGSYADEPLLGEPRVNGSPASPAPFDDEFGRRLRGRCRRRPGRPDRGHGVGIHGPRRRASLLHGRSRRVGRLDPAAARRATGAGAEPEPTRPASTGSPRGAGALAARPRNGPASSGPASRAGPPSNGPPNAGRRTARRRTGPEPDRHREPDRASPGAHSADRPRHAAGHHEPEPVPSDRSTRASRRNAGSHARHAEESDDARRRADRARHRRPDH